MLPLSQNEFCILRLMWEEKRALSRPEIIEKLPDKNWNPNSIHLILNNMIQKGVIEVVGMTRCGRGYGRTYAPTLTEIAYAVAQAVQASPDYDAKTRLLGMTAELLKQDGIDAETIGALEKLLAEKKQKLGAK